MVLCACARGMGTARPSLTWVRRFLWHRAVGCGLIEESSSWICDLTVTWTTERRGGLCKVARVSQVSGLCSSEERACGGREDMVLCLLNSPPPDAGLGWVMLALLVFKVKHPKLQHLWAFLIAATYHLTMGTRLGRLI